MKYKNKISFGVISQFNKDGKVLFLPDKWLVPIALVLRGDIRYPLIRYTMFPYYFIIILYSNSFYRKIKFIFNFYRKIHCISCQTSFNFTLKSGFSVEKLMEQCLHVALFLTFYHLNQCVLVFLSINLMRFFKAR